jgi:mannose/fructose/N-acetylgalactosamine-specific phosphotransferase system component IIB
VISLVRVDNRLIHGQVVEAWLPHLKVARVIVADEEAAESPLIRAAMGLAVSTKIQVSIERPEAVDFPAVSTDPAKTLVLLREVEVALKARERGLKLEHLNLGNVHFSSGRRQVSASVFLSQEELDRLKMLVEQGVEVEARGVPSDRPVPFTEMVERFGKGS